MTSTKRNEQLEIIRSSWRADVQEFAENVLRPHRERLNLNQTEMALRIGVDQSRISRIERGLGVPRDQVTAIRFADEYRLEEIFKKDWLQLLFGYPNPRPAYSDHLLQLYGISLDVSELNQEEYLHIHEGNRIEFLTRAAQMINNVAPVEASRRKWLRHLTTLSALDAEALGLSTYIDHDTDHAVMLLLEWLQRHDPVRWQDLLQNLERLIDIAYRQALEASLDIAMSRTLNTVLCYAERFGPLALSDKSMTYALNLWTQERSVAADYIYRDMLHCDVFSKQPLAEDRFHDFLDSTFQSTSQLQRGRDEQVIPGLEVLYFSPSIWASQGNLLKNRLLPVQSEMKANDFARVLSQVLNHINKPGAPALSEANYILVCLKLIEANADLPFTMLNQQIVDQLAELALLPTPTAFRGDPLLRRIWSEMTRQFGMVERSWERAQAEFRSTYDIARKSRRN